jgi:YVTN family beta-propeller protein
VANDNARNISKIDTATGSLVERIPSGGYGPSGVGVTPDGALLYVTNTRDDAVSVISTSTRAVVANVKVGERPKAFGRFSDPLPPGNTLAVEGATSTVGASTVVRFGAGTRWTEKKVTGTATCSNAFFGTDPGPYLLKSCVVGTPVTTPPTIGLILAYEDGTFAVDEPSIVIYGAGMGRVERTVDGTVNCSNAFFGIDPAPGVRKYCVFLSDVSTFRQ